MNTLTTSDSSHPSGKAMPSRPCEPLRHCLREHSSTIGLRRQVIEQFQLQGAEPCQGFLDQGFLISPPDSVRVCVSPVLMGVHGTSGLLGEAALLFQAPEARIGPGNDPRYGWSHEPKDRHQTSSIGASSSSARIARVCCSNSAGSRTE